MLRSMYLLKLSAFCFTRQSHKAFFQAHTVFFYLREALKPVVKSVGQQEILKWLF